jgi:hypothetical protein
MSSDSIEKLLSQLEDSRVEFGPKAASKTRKILNKLAASKIPDAESLTRLHENLLFLRAHPPGALVLSKTEAELSRFYDRVEQLRSAGADLYSLDYIECSGISGTTISGTFSYDIVSWLVKRYSPSVDIDWDKYAKSDRMRATLPRFVPLLYEDTLVEANIPYRDWLRAVRGKRKRSLEWLINRLESLPITLKERSELYDALEIPVRWELGRSPESRTLLKRPVKSVYFHSGPFIQRRDISLAEVFNSPPVPLDRCTKKEGEIILDMVRASTTVRYRELYGITHGDPAQVVEANLGRGVEVFLWGLPRARRLPIRAYHAGFTLKNGVPINYIEAISLFDRTEVGFNTFYTFREGESAWVYGQVLRLLNQILGVTCISIDPYQIGFNNDEAVESGAFWFYRKLGFRPTRKEFVKLVAAEEKKVRTRPGYRTPGRILRRLSHGNMVYEIPGSPTGEWDGFHVRNLGVAVNRVVGEEFNGEAEKMRAACRKSFSNLLEIDLSSLSAMELETFDDFTSILYLVPGLERWSSSDKNSLVGLIRSKMEKEELRYLKLLQQHDLLREAIIKLGSNRSEHRARRD